MNQTAQLYYCNFLLNKKVCWYQQVSLTYTCRAFRLLLFCDFFFPLQRHLVDDVLAALCFTFGRHLKECLACACSGCEVCLEFRGLWVRLGWEEVTPEYWVYPGKYLSFLSDFTIKGSWWEMSLSIGNVKCKQYLNEVTSSVVAHYDCDPWPDI